MDVHAMLQILNADPSRMEPAPPSALRLPGAADRIGLAPKACVSCGQPARATRIVDIPGYGHRWVDKCREHFLAVAKRGGPKMPSEETLAVRDAARAAGTEDTST